MPVNFSVINPAKYCVESRADVHPLSAWVLSNVLYYLLVKMRCPKRK